jgi:hypothetical protein
MADGRKPTMWRRHIDLWWKIPQYRPKLSLAESPKIATDTRHGRYSITLQENPCFYLRTRTLIFITVPVPMHP